MSWCLGVSSLLSAQPTQTYDSGDPTAAEQLVLEIVNRARANPDAEGTRLGIDIREGLSASDAARVGARPPLAMNRILLGVARAHSQDMWTRNFFAHTNPDGIDPFQRMLNAGYDWQVSGGSAAENIAAGSNFTSAQLEDFLMIDAGVAGRGHRVNLLDIRDPPYFREAGMGAYDNGTANPSGYRDFLTQDFGTSTGGPFLVGVVYADANANGFYDIGEGMAGVTVMPDGGTFYAITGTAGAYAFPVGTSGTLTVTASGGGMTAPAIKRVTLSGSNAKLDFKASDAGTGGTTTGGTTTGGTTTGSTTTGGTTTGGTTTGGTTTGGTTGAAATGGASRGGGGGGVCFAGGDAIGSGPLGLDLFLAVVAASLVCRGRQGGRFGLGNG